MEKQSSFNIITATRNILYVLCEIQNFWYATGLYMRHPLDHNCLTRIYVGVPYCAMSAAVGEHE